MRERTATFRIRVISAPEPPEPPFVGTRIGVRIDEGLVFKVKSISKDTGSATETVDWGDGVIETLTDASTDLVHTYPAPGDYEIRVSDDMRTVMFAVKDDASEYTARFAPMVRSFVTNATRLYQIGGWGFKNCVNMTRLDASNSSLERLNVGAFYGCRALAGELRFPRVREIKGGVGTEPFSGCTGITRLIFSKANEAAIKSDSAYAADPTLGTGIANVCRFDP